MTIIGKWGIMIFGFREAVIIQDRLVGETIAVNVIFRRGKMRLNHIFIASIVVILAIMQ